MPLTLRDGWAVRPLGNVATLQRGFDLPLSDRIPGPVPVIGSSGLVGSHAAAACKGPGVLVGRSGSVGQVVWIEQDYWPLNTTLWVKDFHGNDPAFVYFLLLNFDFSRFVSGVSVPTLNRNLVHPIPVVVPPLADQRAIAGALRAVERAKLAAKQRETALDGLFGALLEELLSGRLPVSGPALDADPG